MVYDSAYEWLGIIMVGIVFFGTGWFARGRYDKTKKAKL